MRALLTSKDLIALLGITPKTLGRHVARGLLPPPIRIGRRMYWRVDQIEAALASHHVPTAAKGPAREAANG